MLKALGSIPTTKRKTKHKGIFMIFGFDSDIMDITLKAKNKGKNR